MKLFRLRAVRKDESKPEPLLEFVDVEPGPGEDPDFLEVWIRQHELGHEPRRVGTLELLRTGDHDPYRWMFFGQPDGYMREEHLMEVATKLAKLHARDYS